MEGIKAGDILLVHTKKGFLPKAIRYFTKCHYNHVAIVVRSMGTLCVIEAVRRGFIITKTLEDYLDQVPDSKEILVKRPSRGPVNMIKINKRLLDIVGHPYDFKSLFYSQLIKQVSQRYRWVGYKYMKAARRVYCSEAAAYIYSELFPNWWAIAPVDLYTSKDLKTILELK